MFKKYFMFVTVVIMTLMMSMTAFAGCKKFGKYNRKAFEERMIERAKASYCLWMNYEIIEDSLYPEDEVVMKGIWEDNDRACVIVFSEDEIYISLYDLYNFRMIDNYFIEMTEDDYEKLYNGDIGFWGLMRSCK